MESFVKIATWRTFRPKLKQLKQPTRKNSLYLEKWNFLALILKHFFNFLIIQEIKTPKKISYFQETKTIKNLLSFWEMELLRPSQKKFLVLQEKNSPKNFSKESLSLYFGKMKPRKNSLYFRKRNFLIFQGTETLKNFLYFRK